MEIGGRSVEQPITLYDELSFVDKQDVPANDATTPAYTLEGPDGYVVAVMAGTNVAPEFRDSNGDKLDGSTRVIIQKCDKQGNPLGDGIVLNEQINRFDFQKMRTDPEFFRKTSADLMVDEREIVKIFLDIPSGANGFDASESNLAIGDDTSDYGKPVEIVDHDELTPQESQAVKVASQRGGGR